MKHIINKTHLAFPVLALFAGACNTEKEPANPNIVIIYADDMGYGDLNVQNPDSKIPTPYLDQLAAEGMRFTDAHSSSGVCSPSRFAMLTGTYHWRRQHGIVGSFGEPFFNDGDLTLPQVLKDNGYTTACIGKWHLGWDWQFINDPSLEIELGNRTRQVYKPDDIDWSKPIKGGPLDRGFDYYFGDGTINFPPYTWIENDMVMDVPTELMITNNRQETKEGNWEFRPGPIVKSWEPYDVLPTLTQKATEWISRQDKSQPFFLYFPLPSPHAPIIPNDEFLGKSEAGGYGDFVYQTDWVAGQVLNALKEHGFEENTLVIFSSDNGPEKYAFARARDYDHFSMGELRGLKVDIWEGGHRVPTIIKWPGKVQAGSVSDKLISQLDFMPTLATIADIELPGNSAPDGYNILPTLLGESYDLPERDVLIHNTWEDMWAVRQANWLYLDDSTGEGRVMPQYFKDLRGYTDFETDGLLFNLAEDPGQRVNLYEKYPEKVAQMKQLIEDEKSKGYLIKD